MTGTDCFCSPVSVVKNSVDEICFLFMVDEFGIEQADFWAKGLGLKYDAARLYSDLRYDEHMKSDPDPETTPQQKMDRFQAALGRILTVSKDELNKRIADDETIRRRTKGKPGPKPSSASGRVSDV